MSINFLKSKAKKLWFFLCLKKNQALDFLNAKSYLKTLAVFSFYTIVFSYIYFSVYTLSTGDDHFFHFRFAEIMRDKGLLESFRDFKSLYFSKMAQSNDYFVYYNFLFYLFIVPFTYIKPLFLGIKLYAVITSSLAFSVLYWCIKKMDVKYAFFWSVILCSITGSSLMFRFFLSRPYILAPAILLLLLYCLNKKKYWAVFILNLIYLFWHSATFYMSAGVALIYYIFEKFYYEKGNLKNLCYTFFGMTFGIMIMYVISPGFIIYIQDIIFGVYKDTILGKNISIPEGNELYPANLFDFIGANPLLVSGLIIATTFFIYKYFESKNNPTDDYTKLDDQSRKHVTGAAFFLAISFFLGTILISKRFQDFFVFFGGFFIVLSFDEIISYIRLSSESAFKALRTGLVVVFVYLFSFNMLTLQTTFSNGARPETFEQVGEWLNKNVSEGEVIFYPTWNWFPQMYYHSPTHNYVIGLEPRFLYVYSPVLYWKWAHISGNGYVCETEECPQIEKISKSMKRKDVSKKEWYKKEGDEVADSIRTDFKSSYVVISKKFINLNEIMDNSKRFEKVFSDRDNLFIYKIN